MQVLKFKITTFLRISIFTAVSMRNDFVLRLIICRLNLIINLKIGSSDIRDILFFKPG